MNLTLTRPLVVLDVETTGTSPALDRIVSIAWQVFSGNDARVWMMDSYSTLVNPGCPIPPEATEIHKITDEMVEDAPSFATLAPRLSQILYGADVAGMRVKFDVKMLTESYLRERIPCPFGASLCVIDTARLWQILEPRTLEDAVARWAPDILEWFKAHAHDAEADVTAAAAVLEGQLATGKLPDTVEALHVAQWPWPEGALDPDGKIVWKDGCARWTFGKHAGLPVHSTDEGYFRRFILDPKNDFSPEVKALARKVLAGERLEPRA